jgi:hypothetical protein
MTANSSQLIKREREMTHFKPELETRRGAALFFALLSGFAAISTAVVPAILNI